MSGHGGLRRGSGRKKIFVSKKEYSSVWQTGHRRISLDYILYSSWVSAKLKCGYTSDSEFASHLLSLERRRRENDPVVSCAKRKGRFEEEDVSRKRRRHVEGSVLATSTPVKPVLISVQSPNLSLSSATSDVDVTGITEFSINDSSYQVVDNSVILPNDQDKYQDSIEPTSDSDSSDETERTERSLTDAVEYALRELDEDHQCQETEWLSDTSDIDDLEHSVHVEETDYENKSCVEDSDHELEVGNEKSLSSSASSVPLPSFAASSISLPSPSAPTIQLTATPDPAQTYPKLSRLEEQNRLTEELSLVRQTKVICSLDQLLDVFKKCQHTGCTSATVIKHHLNGPTAVISWTCSSGHRGTFCSSREQNGIYCNNLQVAASIMLSGNNFAKVEKMAKFLGLSFISDSTFYRMQRLYFIPAINEWWTWQREQLVRELVDKEVVVCGDGQCDSPGYTAKNLCYFLMELLSGYILEIEVRDKRHVGLASTNMEKQALQNALERLRASLNVVEVVTDASPSIKKLLADNFATVFHSLDVWHKTKSIRKCLAKVGHLKKMEKIQAWTDHIILHFWHCANVCKATESTSDDEALEKMKSTWIGLLHHVCDDHEWTGGKCEHGELDEHDLPWFDRRDKDYEALQKTVLDPQLLGSFKFYVRFRHTGSLECANNLSLVYTPKRCSYSYRSYKARKQLSAIDWNYHLNQAAATTKAGEMIVSRKYNQRTKEWNSKVVKVKKQYEYIPVLMAKIMQMRKEDTNKVTRNVPLNDSDPALLAPTIAVKPPPPSKELFLVRKSRFQKSEKNENTKSSTSDM